MTKKLLTTSEAAELAGISRSTLVRAASNGQIPYGIAKRVLGKIIWERKRFEAWLDSCDVGADVPSQPQIKKQKGRSRIEQTVIAPDVDKVSL